MQIYPGKFRPARNLSVDPARIFDDGTIDFIFLVQITGMKLVKADAEAWLPKREGRYCRHDYSINFSGIVEAVKDRERKAAWYQLGCRL